MIAWLKRAVKTKTFWVSLTGIIGIIGTMAMGEQSAIAGLLEILGLLIVMAGRDAIAKITPPQ